jgi:single-strand DNA-binding protein
MATLNKVMLIGRLTKDPEAPRVLPNSGSTVVKFRFAVGRSKKNDQGGWDKDPNQLYIDCEVFSRPDSKRNLAELISKYAKQGDPMYLEGRLVFEEWEDKNGGGKRSKHKLVVDSVEFLGGRNSEDGGGSGEGRSSSGSRQTGSGRSAPPPDSGGPEDFGGGDGGGSGGGNDPIPF